MLTDHVLFTDVVVQIQEVEVPVFSTCLVLLGYDDFPHGSRSDVIEHCGVVKDYEGVNGCQSENKYSIFKQYSKATIYNKESMKF